MSAKAINYNPSGIVFAVCGTASSASSTAGDDAAYVFGVTPWAPTPSIRCDYTGWTATEFSEKYVDTYGVPPSYHAAAAFAGGVVLGAAMEATGTTNSSVVRDAIRAGQYQTIYGNVSFSEVGQSLSEMMLVQMQPESLQFAIVWPMKYAVTEAVYPVPTWAQRDCASATSDCDGHGECDASGKCVCDFGYYGFDNLESCDTYCVGTFHPDTGACTRATTYYIGMLTDEQFPDMEEYRAQARLAVDMVNNKTDG